MKDKSAQRTGWEGRLAARLQYCATSYWDRGRLARNAPQRKVFL
jgi:hypothetical protein